MRIRIVEDNADLAWATQLMLRLEGHHVQTWGANFGALLDTRSWQDIDVALVDLMLGGEPSGRGVLAWLSEYEPEIRRVVFTATWHPDADVYALAHAVVLKPASPEKLLEAIDGR